MRKPSITFLCALVVGVYACLLVVSAKQGGWLHDGAGQPRTADYISMWAAGHVALEGRPADAYDWAAAKAAQTAALGRAGTRSYPWAYPPPYIALVAAFALLPYVASMLLFSALTLALLGFVSARIVGRPEGAVWMLATPAVLLNIWVGQNGALSAALLGAGLLLGPVRPIAAGIAIGLLAFKPQLGLLIPLALLAVGNWRMIAAAAATIAAMALAALVVMGLEPWAAFYTSLTRFAALVLSDAYPTAHKLQSVYGLGRTLGLGSAVALSLQYVSALLAAGCVVVLWRSTAPYDLKCAGLAIAATFASPYIFAYDMTMLTLATAFMVRHALATGSGPYDGPAIVAAHLMVIAFPGLGFPTGILAASTLAVLLAWHIRASRDAAMDGTREPANPRPVSRAWPPVGPSRAT